MQIYVKNKNIDQYIKKISNYLELNIVFDVPKKSYYFVYDSNGLSFIKDANNPREILHVDFLKGAIGWRMKRVQHESNIKKALGKNLSQLEIFDATGGFLSDSIIFLSLGHKVMAVEQSKIIFSLVNDAILRAEQHFPVLKNLKFINDNSIEVYKRENREFDVIYLDPMYPEIKKNNKKTRNIEGIKKILKLENLWNKNDQIIDAFFKSSYKKIILKRPLKSKKNYSNINYQVIGKTTRFDIYI